jgi:hypothetical protein
LYHSFQYRSPQPEQPHTAPRIQHLPLGRQQQHPPHALGQPPAPIGPPQAPHPQPGAPVHCSPQATLSPHVQPSPPQPVQPLGPHVSQAHSYFM